MIKNDRELTVTRQRIGCFEQMIDELRRICAPKQYGQVVPAYLAEVERMRAEVDEYLAPSAAQKSVASN